MADMSVGGGGRFASLVGKLKAKGSVKNPRAVAAAIGMKKYGKKRMESMAQAGKK